MVILVQIAGVLGFVLSVVNLVIMLYSHRAALMLRNCLFVPIDQGEPESDVILDATLVNCSGLPISIYDWSLGLSSMDALAPVEHRNMITLLKEKTENGMKVKNQQIVTSKFPINLNPYEAKHIVVTVLHHDATQEALRLAEAGSSHQEEANKAGPLVYYMVAHTSRRKKKAIPFVAETMIIDTWLLTAREVD